MPLDSGHCDGGARVGGARADPPPAGAAAAEPLNLWTNIQRLKLDVAQIAPIHGRIVPFSAFRRAVEQSNDTN